MKSSVVFCDKQVDKRTELANCTFVRTVLMLSVVASHCALFWGGGWFEVKEPVFVSQVLKTLAAWLNSFHIYGFVLISGYLFYYLKHERGKYSEFLPFAVNKMKRLIIPYVFVSLVWVIPFAVYYFHYDLNEIVVRFALGTSPNQLWFLLMLFSLFMLFYPLSTFFKQHDRYGVIVALLAYGVGMVGWYLDINVFQVFRALTYLPLFLIGFKIRQYGSKKLQKIPSWVYLCVDIVLFASVRYLTGLKGIVFVLLVRGMTFIINVWGALTAFVVLQKIATHIRWKENKAFQHLSKNSMPVYLFHQQIVYVFICCLSGLIHPYFHAVVNFTGAITISLLISDLLMKSEWTRMLIGEK